MSIFHCWQTVVSTRQVNQTEKPYHCDDKLPMSQWQESFIPFQAIYVCAPSGKKRKDIIYMCYFLIRERKGIISLYIHNVLLHHHGEEGNSLCILSTSEGHFLYVILFYQGKAEQFLLY